MRAGTDRKIQYYGFGTARGDSNPVLLRNLNRKTILAKAAIRKQAPAAETVSKFDTLCMGDRQAARGCKDTRLDK
jgi:hypothetical protein